MPARAHTGVRSTGKARSARRPAAAAETLASCSTYCCASFGGYKGWYLDRPAGWPPLEAPSSAAAPAGAGPASCAMAIPASRSRAAALWPTASKAAEASAPACARSFAAPPGCSPRKLVTSCTTPCTATQQLSAVPWRCSSSRVTHRGPPSMAASEAPGSATGPAWHGSAASAARPSSSADSDSLTWAAAALAANTLCWDASRSLRS
mmetsp:Transcript_34930/g.107284  ORF Transcript_34930/g.107284 Transcript_34930/m.107284 type:complete len:207 (-) Transcript_34930:433-1053(-)